MLRHIRMTPTKETNGSVYPKSIPSKLFIRARELTRPLYAYVVPRQLPLPGQPERECHCRYPLYTLCTPKASPYDSPSAGKSVSYLSEAAAPVPAEGETVPAMVPTPKERRRLRPVWRGRSPATLYRPSNIVPGRPPGYRCEVCDGFQQEVDEDEELEELKKANLAGGPTAAMGSSSCREVEEKEEEAAEEEEEDDEDDRLALSTSTDIANTTLEDTDVALLRYQNPFLVEVLGRPPISTQSRQLSRHFQLQLRRCGFSLKDLTLQLPVAATASERHVASYQKWVQSAYLERRKKIKERGPRRRQEHLRQCVALLDTAAYTVRFAVAAYGLPYELGYFNSLKEITKLSAEPHRRYTVATSEEQLESMRRMLHGENFSPLMEYALGRFTTQVCRPSFAIVLDHEERRVVVTFRGTETLGDAVVDVMEGYVLVDLLASGPAALGVEVGSAEAVVDLDHAPVSVRARLERLAKAATAASGSEPMAQRKGAAGDTAADSPPSLPTRVPLGFYESTVESSIAILPALEEIHAQYPDYDLFLTGHSLGGIQATLFHLFYCFPGPHGGRSITPGSHLERKHRRRYANLSSPSLTVPFARTFTITFGAAPVVEEAILARLNEVLREEESRTGSRLLHFMFGKDLVTRLQVRSIRDLLCMPEPGKEGTAEAVKQEIPDEVLPTLALPGSVYHLPDSGKAQRHFFEVEETASIRKELIVNVDSVFHHFPLFYLRSINRLLKHFNSRWLQSLLALPRETGSSSGSGSGGIVPPSLTPSAQTNE